MKRKKRKRDDRQGRYTDKAGLSPGTPVFIGERKQENTRINVMRYSGDFAVEKRDARIGDCALAREQSGVTWVNVVGIHDVNTIAALGDHFGLHPLTQEDIVNTAQRPKSEEFDGYIFIVMKMFSYDEIQKDIDIDTVSIILGKGFVISFLERDSNVFEPVYDRIRNAKGRVRKLDADYLAYALMDTVVDAYFVALERIGDHIESIEDDIVSSPVPAHMQELHRLKREILFVRKSVWPLREEIGSIMKSESPLIKEGTVVFIRDLYDHTIRVIDIVETNRDILSSMHDTYLSSVSNRMNEVMKVLTIIATIFIPLTFIVGVYGMNFDNMPELRWHYGYYGIWGIMGSLGVGMVAYFRKQRWL
jgi:magnesium transporter